VIEPAIQAEQLVREFKKGPRAVDRIDLVVAPGEIYGFLGPNGAGKSTTVHMLTTLLPPTAGTARVAGFDVVHQGPQVRQHIGAALQRPRSTPCSPAASTCACRPRSRGSPAPSDVPAPTRCSHVWACARRPIAGCAATRAG